MGKNKNEFFKYFDPVIKDVVKSDLLESFVAESKNKEWTEADYAKFFGLVPVVLGYGNAKHIFARECMHCGAPVGNVDPDEAKWIQLTLCSDCKE